MSNMEHINLAICLSFPGKALFTHFAQIYDDIYVQDRVMSLVENINNLRAFLILS